jgi:phage-related protein
MSANGEIELAVSAEGVDDAAAELGGGGGGGGGGPGGGGGGLRGNLRAGAIAGLLLSALGPILDVLSPMLSILEAFLAPVSAMLLRLLQPVLRVLFSQVLPAWLSFMSNVNGAVENLSVLSKVATLIGTLVAGLAGAKVGAVVGAIIGGFIGSVVPGAGTAIGAAVGAKVGTIVGGAVGAITGGVSLAVVVSWLERNWDRIGSLAGDIWGRFVSGAGWLTSAPASLAGAIWQLFKPGVNNVIDEVASLPMDIWSRMKRLPGMIATKLKNTIPSFASGGIVSGPTLASVGEQGSEAIIPLDRLEQMLQGQGSGTAVQISGGLAPFVEQVERSSQVDL